MSQQKTALITGSNAKIKVNGVTLAYATDFQYGIAVDTVPVEVMGRYEVLANEPISYTIAGSFAIVRYTAAAAGSNLQGSNTKGNGIKNWGNEAGTMSDQVNPADILASQTVDIELYRKTQDSTTKASGAEQVKKIRDARVTRMGGSINKRGVLVEQFQFVAILADDDSFTAANSGDADLS